jgi:hypothetical protein
MANIKELIKSIDSPDSSFEENLKTIRTMEETIEAMKAQEQQAIQDNVDLIVEAIRTIERKVAAKLIEVESIVREKGEKGDKGADGRNGQPGKDGANGRNGQNGLNGKDGQDGADGVSVTDAHIDFDGSLIITLSTGREINVGEVVAPDLAEKIKLVTSGGGTSQQVLDTLTSLQNQINALVSLGSVTYEGTWNASTNTPTIVAGTGDKGEYYVVSVAGNTSIDGETLWGVGDWIIFNGVVWQKVDGGSTGDLTSLTVRDNTILGSSNTDTVTFTARINSDFEPATDNTYDLGRVGHEWRDLYIDGTANIDNLVADTAAITGGTIDNTVIGGTTPAAGTFTTLTATGQTSLGGAAGSESLRVLTPPSTGRYFIARGASGNPDLGVSGGAMILYGGANQGIAFYSNGYSQAQLNVPHTASAVNFAQATGAATGSGPVFSAQGSDTNIDLNLNSKGTGAVNLNTGGGTQFSVANTASATNYFATTGSNGGTPALFSAGSSTNIGANFVSKGTGALAFYTNGSVVQQVIAHTASAVNFVQVTGAATGNSPNISAQGSDANINLAYSGKGTFGHAFYTNNFSQLQFAVSHTASAVNYVQVTGSATGGIPAITVQGSDSNIRMNISSKGTESLDILTNNTGTRAAKFTHTASAVNWVQMTGAAAGSAPSYAVAGNDTNIDLALTPKGTGNVRFGTFTADMTLVVQGFIEVKDSGGTIRKLAVIA